MSSQPSADELRSIVLGILARREMYGLEVAAQLQLIDEGKELPEGAVYPALRRLEREGLVSAHWVEIGEGAPRRRYYVLTPKGQRAVSPEAATARTGARRTPGPVRP